MGLQKHINVGKTIFANDRPGVVYPGTLPIGKQAHAFDMAGAIKDICARLGAGFVYKSSYDKANRTSIDATRGIGLEGSISVFADLRKEFDIPVLTDVHSETHCEAVASCVDVLQIPAFLCPPDRLAGRRCSNRKGCECQKRAVFGALGHEECRAEGG